jgi:4-aminobutyrate aminotransferase-like enzyme
VNVPYSYSFSAGLFMEKLKALQNKYPDIIGDVRGYGLFIGVEIVKDHKTKGIKAIESFFFFFLL